MDEFANSTHILCPEPLCSHCGRITSAVGSQQLPGEPEDTKLQQAPTHLSCCASEPKAQLVTTLPLISRPALNCLSPAICHSPQVVL